ncbi:nitrogen regulatory protein P-II family [Longilinea arvoryzae]|uniref:Nitrogen regulatory protein P-II family n=1 Tax=Longilinea arvoryzae TaxID=360412 RepID=A0A0S7BIJ0_9CHLR|nr:hypothetical protein [Longilinea arvoryzae]GAP14168.1 nitrogen regulatory protein P-II family [Longilinea arvoryzae]
MDFMVLFVLHDLEKKDDLLNAWDQAGVSGITILPSTGLARYRKGAGLRDDLPLIPSLEDLLERSQNSNRTFFTIVSGEEMVDKVIAATESVTGDLDLPETGILVALPVARVRGLHRKHPEEE